MSRSDDISHEFLENDRIWPFFVPHNREHPFVKALIEVLRHLPDDAYDAVSEFVSFVVEDPQISAVNVPFRRKFPACGAPPEFRLDTVVIFHEPLLYPMDALVGLLAHELAHSFVDRRDYDADEAAADALVLQWGFGEELEALHAHQKRQRDAESSPPGGDGTVIPDRNASPPP